jgi:hypothetical protein
MPRAAELPFDGDVREARATDPRGFDFGLESFTLREA